MYPHSKSPEDFVVGVKSNFLLYWSFSDTNVKNFALILWLLRTPLLQN